MTAIPEDLARAIALHRAGHLPDAAAAYRRTLQTDPHNAQAHYLLGAVCEALGKLDEAAASFAQALRLRPDHADAHNHLGVVLARQGRLPEAVASFAQALRLKPDFADARNNWHKALARSGGSPGSNPGGTLAATAAAQNEQGGPHPAETHYNRANALRQQGKLDEAIACYRRALELKPDFAQAHNSLGIALVRQRQVAAAIASFRHAVRLRPDFAPAHGNLGNALREVGRFDEALLCYREAVRLAPNSAASHSNLGDALREQGKLDEAAAHCRQAIQLEPDCADAHNNLGAILYDQGKPEEAAASYQQAVRRNPDFAIAYDSLGKVLQLLGRFEEAQQCYRRLLQIQPSRALCELRIATICPTVFANNAEIDQYRARLWAELQRLSTIDFHINVGEASGLGCEPPFNLQFHGRNDRTLREAYADVFRKLLPAATPTPRTGRPRIGFVVTRTQGSLFLRSLRGVIERLDPSLCERVIACPAATAEMIRPGFRDPSVRILVLPGRFDLAANAIRDAQFDLLYFWEVATDSMNYLLPFLRLAPVQCTSWGIQVTSGIPTMDYYLSSALVEPADAAEHYSEKLLLASTLLTYQQRAAAPRPEKTRADFALPAAEHLYLCPQQLGKFHPDFDPILAGILRRDAQGLIVITADRYGSLAQQLRRRFAATMPDVAQRVIFLPYQSPPDYLNLIALGDVLLDPLHFGGVNTTYDGFSLNKPIVTLPSQFQRGRYTLACYKKMGLSECVAANPQQYVEIAVALGTDAQYRAEVVQRIRQATPCLFEDMEAVREHERIFQTLIEESRSAPGR